MALSNNRPRKSSASFSTALTLTLATATLGCQALPGAAVPFIGAGAPRITLQRGVTGSTLAMKPPYLSGRDFSLTFRKKILSGWVSPAGAGGGALHVYIEDDTASGFGPHGSVSMDIFNDEDATVADGLWDGQRVHMSFAEGSLSGTVADVRQAGPDNGRRGRPPDSCQYTLDRHAPGRAFEGFSICAGMPQQTTLDVPPTVAALLSRSELVTVLVAMLSAPPLTLSEGGRSLDDLEPLQ